MIEIQRVEALDRSDALVFGCAYLLYISPCEHFSVFICVHPHVCVRVCEYFIGECMDSMIYFLACCSKVGMAFNLAPLRSSQGVKKKKKITSNPISPTLRCCVLKVGNSDKGICICLCPRVLVSCTGHANYLFGEQILNTFYGWRF